MTLLYIYICISAISYELFKYFVIDGKKLRLKRSVLHLKRESLDELRSLRPCALALVCGMSEVSLLLLALILLNVLVQRRCLFASRRGRLAADRASR